MHHLGSLALSPSARPLGWLLLLFFLPGLAAALNREGLAGVRSTHSAQSLRFTRLALNLHAAGLDDERVVRNVRAPESGPLRQPESPALLADLFGSLGLGLADNVDAAVFLPFYYEDLEPFSSREFFPGNLGYRLKVRLPRANPERILDLALIAGGALPTARSGEGYYPRRLDFIPRGSAAETAEARAGGPGGEWEFLGLLAATVDLTPLGRYFQVQWHSNVGARRAGLPKDRDFPPVFFWSSALEYRLPRYGGFFAEFTREARFETLSGEAESGSDPSHLSLGVVASFPLGIEAQAGLTLGFARDSYESATLDGSGGERRFLEADLSPEAALFAQLGWSGFLVPQDDDGDGIVNKQDACPEAREDKDGFKDRDGCPEGDNDGDGVPDTRDRCRDITEDPDGVQDGDGCPDLDNDKDGIPDARDTCPNDPEDLDGIEDTDGCPDLDNDKDGILDSQDRCPAAAEDFDGHEDGDGCPDLDRDRDGINDSLDKCPREPETANFFLDEDGCPDDKPAPLRNMILKGVQFKTASAELTFESYAPLDSVAEQLKAYPEVVLEIQGHTDNLGGEMKNLRLSQDRAESVTRYLISKGVEPARLRATGFGASRPIASNKSAEGRTQNRRVEMYRLK